MASTRQETPSAPSRGVPSRTAPLGFASRTPPRPSAVFDSFWHFANARQEVYFRRLCGLPAPWTADPIIHSYRFTNAYRAADRVSQYLIKHVIYGDQRSSAAEEVVFRVLLFKLFNKIETWQLLEESLGQLAWSSYSFRRYNTILTRAIDSGRRLYSAAYIMPACAAMSTGDGRKHRTHLRLLEHLIQDGLAAHIGAAKSLKDAFLLLRSYPMLGDFLAYQYLIDLNYSTVADFSEDDFVVPGPGAREGLRKVFSDPGEFDEADLIRWVADRQEKEFSRRGLAFRSLWGRRLHLIDCQNLFCEIGKYARVRHPEFTEPTGRSRIKQKFDQAGPLPIPWFPPKWGLNKKITESLHPRTDAVSDGALTPINAVAGE